MRFISRTQKYTAYLIGGLCILLGWLMYTYITQLNKIPVSVEGAVSLSPEPITDPQATTTTKKFINTQPFLLDVRPFWQDTIPLASCPTPNPQPILVLPHYIPTYEYIRRALATWSACHPSPIERVVVIGPDHRHALSDGAATLSTDGYQTPLGTIDTDKAVQDALVRSAASSTEALFRVEHGVGVFPIFIQKTFPQATFTPVVISAQANKSQVSQVAEALRPLLQSSSTLLIVSADFSHYLARNEADKKDRDTKKALLAGNKTFFWSASDDYTDFGRGIWLALQLIDPQATFYDFDHLSSTDLGGSSQNTTSFFLGWWR